MQKKHNPRHRRSPGNWKNRPKASTNRSSDSIKTIESRKVKNGDKTIYIDLKETDRLRFIQITQVSPGSNGDNKLRRIYLSFPVEVVMDAVMEGVDELLNIEEKLPDMPLTGEDACVAADAAVDQV